MEHWPASTSLGGRGAHSTFSGRRHRGGPSRAVVDRQSRADVERQSGTVADRPSKAVADRSPMVLLPSSCPGRPVYRRRGTVLSTRPILSMRPSPFADAGVPSGSPLLVESRLERVGVHSSDGYRHTKVNIVSVRWVYYLNNNYSQRSPRTVRHPNGAYLV